MHIYFFTKILKSKIWRSLYAEGTKGMKSISYFFFKLTISKFCFIISLSSREIY